MMKKLIILALVLVFAIQLVNAAEVCVVIDYNNGDKPDSECVNIDEGINGYELLNEIGWSIEWTDFGGDLGHGLCGINNVGGTSDNCWVGDKYWNFRIVKNGEWEYTNYGFDGNPHYETKAGDFLGLAYGVYGTKPKMFTANITKVYVDGKKEREKNVRKGKIDKIFPESKLKFKIELENLYDSDTDIEITDISIIGTIEDILDGDDIEEEISEFDLKADRKKSENLEFTIPLKVESKDRLLVIEIEAEDDTGIKYYMEFTYDLEIEKEDHDVRIMKAELNKESYKCGENALLGLSLLNVGDKDEKVHLQIANEDLDIYINERFELSSDAFEESSTFEKRFNLWLPDDISKGTYPITVKAIYDDEETQDINLVISGCEGQEFKETEEIIEIQTFESPKEEVTQAELTKEEITTIKETISDNMPLILTGTLAILIIIMLALGAGFYIIRK